VVLEQLLLLQEVVVVLEQLLQPREVVVDLQQLLPREVAACFQLEPAPTHLVVLLPPGDMPQPGGGTGSEKIHQGSTQSTNVFF